MLNKFINPNNLIISHEFAISYPSETEGFGDLNGLGDINGDGYDDIIVGDPKQAVSDSNALSISYVIFGKIEGYSDISLANSSSYNGFKITSDRVVRPEREDDDWFYGSGTIYLGGHSVSGAGDINGDGYDDIVIGARYVENRTGACYVLFGHPNNFSNIHLNNISSSQGFSIFGKNIGDFTCDKVSKAGDTNADGYKDIIIGAPSFYYSQNDHNGTSYVIFGKANHSNIYLSNLTLEQGFSISGEKDSYNGYEVSGAGDLNGDGYDEVITVTIGPNENLQHSYVIFGKAEGHSNIYLPKLSNSQGYKITGAKESGVSGLRDINGDGLDDMIISSPGSSYSGGKSYSGIAYVIFGRMNESSDIDLNSLSNTQGFKIYGKGTFDQIGEALDGVGDFNGDGVNDILIGSSNDEEGAYLIFGRYNGITDLYLSNLTSNQGLFISSDGEARKVSRAGDINGDGYNDILIGYSYEDYSGSEYKLTQINYLIYGMPNGFTSIPTMVQTFSPTANYSSIPTILVTPSSSLKPSVIPTTTPTAKPTVSTSISPTKIPSFLPSLEPSASPLNNPTSSPSILTHKPTTNIPSIKPTNQPTMQPSITKEIILDSLVLGEGFPIYNVDLYATNRIGDFNGDGYEDFAITASISSASSFLSEGRVLGYVIYGQQEYIKEINLKNIQDRQGFAIYRNSSTGSNVEGAFIGNKADLNLDGFDDLIIGDSSSTTSGTTYIIFGRETKLDDIFLSQFNHEHGFKILGKKHMRSGFPVSSAGDFNGDGYPDIIISGLDQVERGTRADGLFYILFPKLFNFNDIDLNFLTPTQGFKISGGGKSNSYIVGDSRGHTAKGVGDFNSDGFDDIIIGGAHSKYSYDSDSYLDKTFIIFGREENTADIDLDLSNLYKVITIYSPERKSRIETEYVFSGIGDFNGDKFADLAIALARESTVYILYGGLNADKNDIYLNNLSADNAFIIIGVDPILNNPNSISGAGDFNNDGFDDIIIGYPGFFSQITGSSVLIFGTNYAVKQIYVKDITSNQGIIFSGSIIGGYSGCSVSNVGDINRDNYDDIIIHSYISKYEGVSQNMAYVIYGSEDFINRKTVNPIISPTHIPTQLPTIIHSTLPSSYPTNIPSTTPKIISISDRIYAVFSREVYANSDHTPLLSQMNENGSRFPSGWSILLDSESAGIVSDTSIAWGFFAKAYKNDNSDNVVVAFQGTDDLYDLSSADKDLFLGKVPTHYSPAKEFIDYIIDYYQLNPSVISFTGHSLGGFLAQLMSATYNKPSVIFDSPGAGKIITDYYGDSSYSIEYSVNEISNKVKCYNSAPNLINIASGAHFGNVIRIFPEFDPSSVIYTLQQHDMSNILLQFKTTSGDAKISSSMNGYWKFSGTVNNWPFYEATSLFDLDDLNNFLNEVFFSNYNQNPYFWELAWDQSPNINSLSLLFPSTADRIKKIELMSGIISDSTLTVSGIVINGNDNGNKFSGSTNFADTMNGGKGNDKYYPFSGMNTITDTGGKNNYYFYTHNMKGTTTIIDQDKTGNIKFVNIGCGIGKVYKIDEGNSNAFAFFPVFDSSCDLKKYSSGTLESIFGSNVINHKNDVVLLKYFGEDLLISYNNNGFSDSTRNKISIANFNEGDFSIFTNNNAEDQNTYIAVGGDGDEQFICNSAQNSVLAGLGGTNTYFMPLFPSQFSCSIISNDDSTNVYKFTTASNARTLFEYKSALNSVGSTNIFGIKKTDIIDISAFKFNNFSSLSYKASVNGTSLNLPGGLSINLDQSKTFLLTLDGKSFAFYNSSDTSYSTNMTHFGINITEILNIYHTTPDYYYDTDDNNDIPTTIPTSYSDNSNVNYLTEGEIAGIIIGGFAVLGSAVYSLYAYNNDMWPFAGEMAKVSVDAIQNV